MKGRDEWEKKKRKDLRVDSLNWLENSHWLNIKPEVENENPVCINWDHVDQWRELLQVTEKQRDQKHVVLLTPEQEQVKEVIDVKKRKIENKEIHGAYECLPDIGQKCISTRWVIMGKLKDKRKIMKALLVACGYEKDSHNLKTDSAAMKLCIL